jgi:hypothetical protein
MSNRLAHHLRYVLLLIALIIVFPPIATWLPALAPLEKEGPACPAMSA